MGGLSTSTPSKNGLVCLAVAAPSSVATLDFTQFIDSTYDEYELHLINLIADINGQNLFLRTSADGGATWDSGAGNYCHALLSLDVTYAVSTQGSAAQTAIKLNLTGTSSTANDNGISGVLKLWKPSSTAGFFQVSYAGVQAITGGTVVPISVVGERLAAAAVNGVRLFFGNGALIASGLVKLYGVRKFV